MTTTDLDLTGFYADSVESGLTVTQDTLLDGIVAAGVAYIDQVKATITGDTKSFTASKDTYIDVKADGTYTYIEEILNDPAPALTADSIRLAKVVTDGTEITTITDLRTLTVYQYVFGLVDISGGSTMELYNPSGATVMVRFGSGSTSGGMPLGTGETRHVTELVYVKPESGKGGLRVTK